jgi:hypothetical protein
MSDFLALENFSEKLKNSNKYNELSNKDFFVESTEMLKRNKVFVIYFLLNFCKIAYWRVVEVVQD